MPCWLLLRARGERVSKTNVIEWNNKARSLAHLLASLSSLSSAASKKLPLIAILTSEQNAPSASSSSSSKLHRAKRGALFDESSQTIGVE